jgi:hypothetical protein
MSKTKTNKWLYVNGKRKKTNLDVQEALEGKGKPRCDKIGVQLSGPYSDRFWSELCSPSITSSVVHMT